MSIKEETLNWMCDKIKELSEENEELHSEIENLKQGIANAILEPDTKDNNGNGLTLSQIRDHQLKKIADLIFPKNITPMMGLFMDTQDDLDNLKIGFKS